MLRFAYAEEDRNKVVSALAQIEARSAICRLRRRGLITPAEASQALEALAGEMRRMIEQPTNPPVFEAASALVDRYALRTLDAVQLGSAIVSRDLLAFPTMRVISSDKALLEAAQAEGFYVWDPTTQPWAGQDSAALQVEKT